MSKFARMRQDSGNGLETIRSVIESVGTYLPETDVSTRAILEGCHRHLLVPLERWSGIKSRRMAGTTEFSVDLAERAVARCLEKSRYSARDVELLICCNISKQDESDRFTLEPTTSATLLTKFDFANPVHFDLSNACAGLFTGIYVADSLIRQKVFSRVMVVSGEYITHLTRTAQIEIESVRDPRMACLTLGDAAAAVLLEASTQPDVGFRRLDLRSAPEHSMLCIAKTTDKAHGGAIMFTDSMGLNEHATESSVLHVLATLEAAQVEPEEIDHWIMHQTSQRALRGGAAAFNRALGRTAMHDGNLVDNLGRRGNTASTSHFVALADLIESDRIRSGQHIVFAVQASGITYGTAIYELDDLPARLRNGGHGKSASANGHGEPAGASASSGSALRFQRLRTRVQVESAAAVLPEHEAETEIQMASRAAKECLARSKYSASQVDVLIFTGVYRSEFLSEPAVATLVARELGITGAMRTDRDNPFFAFDITNGSLGSLLAAWVASNLINDGSVKVAMVVSGECIQKQDGTLGIVDSASALVLDAGDGTVGFDSFCFTSTPEHHGAFRSYANTAEGPARLGFRGSLEDVRRLAVPELRRAMERHFEEGGLTRDGIGAVLAPQGTDGFSERLASGLGLPAQKVIDAGKGNVSASSLAFALLSTIGCTGGKPLLVMECAPGLQVGSATYYGGLTRQGH